MPTPPDLPPLEERLGLAAAARLLSVTAPTLWRWHSKGTRHGVRLKTICIGSRRYTTRAWLAEFSAACTAAADAELRSADDDGDEVAELPEETQRRLQEAKLA